jgi:hypothetical protein
VQTFRDSMIITPKIHTSDGTEPEMKVTLEIEIPDGKMFREQEVKAACDKIIHDNIAANFAAGGRPQKWQPHSAGYRAQASRLGGKGKMLIDTGNMYSNIMRGHCVTEKFYEAGPWVFRYKFPMEVGKQIKYLVPLTGAKSKKRKMTTYYGPNSYRLKKRQSTFFKQSHSYLTPPRPWDYIAPNDVSIIEDMLINNTVNHMIKKEAREIMKDGLQGLMNNG